MNHALTRLRTQTLALLRAGTSPQKLAECLALSLSASICPVLGVSTPLLTVLALWRKLNLPLIQAVNYLATPLQWLLIVPFIRLGEWLTRATPLALTPAEILSRARADTALFFKEFGVAIWHAALGWLATAPFLFLALYLLLLPIAQRLQHRAKP